MSERSIIAITMGDASGIGPEITAKLLSKKETYDLSVPLVIGNAFDIAGKGIASPQSLSRR